MLKEMRGVEARVSKWMAFPRRNLAPTLGKDVVERARVYLHAPVVELVMAEMGAGGGGDGADAGGEEGSV